MQKKSESQREYQSKSKQPKDKKELSKEHEVEVEDLKSKSMKTVTQVAGSRFSGPIPPPDIIRGYEEIVPGAADRIITMAEKQSDHRQRMEEIMIQAESRDGLLGIVFAFALGLGCIIVAAIIVILVPKSAGAIFGSLLGITGIGSIIVTFITSTHANSSNEHSEKKEK